MSVAAKVKELRQLTGAPIKDCNTAIKESEGDMQKAHDWLRKKSIASADKKAGRVSAEGLVGLQTTVSNGLTKAVLCELNSETDFVAKNDQFLTLLDDITATAAASSSQAILDGDIEALKSETLCGAQHDVSKEITDKIALIGENINLRRISVTQAPVVAAYLHNAVSASAGKIGVCVSMETEGDKVVAERFGKSVAMHIAAFKPASLTVNELDQNLVQKERDILTEQARASGKPDNVIEKMIEGRIRKFYGEVVLLEQPFVMDNKQTVQQALEAAEKEAGGNIRITGYTCFTLGEGIEKKEENFAEEAAKIAAGG